MGIAKAGRGGFMRLLAWTLGLLAVLAVATWLAFQLSPWPSVLLIRHAFGQGSADASQALHKHVPAGIREWRDIRYDPHDPDGWLDLYAPADATAPLATIVWIHGGGFVSGDKADIGNYARVLAGQGFAVASVQYTIAPEARYPVPVRQANAALAFLAGQAGDLPVDASRLVLAGDSAGAQVAAQLAAALSSPAYARSLRLAPALAPGQLAGTLLYCGPHDATLVEAEGAFAGFMRTVLWSYLGTRDYQGSPALLEMSVPRHVVPGYPPSFISAGNADPLLAHSVALADALRAQGVRVETLFFPDDHQPALGHEYQFDLDRPEGALALSRSVAFLRGLPPGEARSPDAPAR